VAASATSVYPGVPSRWHRFDPLLGLQRLRNLIASVGRDDGIEVTGDVGVNSHAGDLLRRAAIPSRLGRAAQAGAELRHQAEARNHASPAGRVEHHNPSVTRSTDDQRKQVENPESRELLA
jgi:hypothetical protein